MVRNSAAAVASPFGFLCVLLLASGTASCSRPAYRDSGDVTLRIGVGVGRSAQGSGLSVLTEMLYAEPLIGLRADGQPVGRLAESWRWDDGRRTLRVVLRGGTKLHDGRTLDSGTARLFLQSRMEALKQQQHLSAFDGVSSIETPDQRTLVVRLREPDAFLIPEFNNAFLVDPASPQTGTGPFKLVSRSPVRAERFDEHHRGAPSIAAVEIRRYESQRAAWAALMRNEVDAVQEVNRDSVEFLERTPGVQVFGSLRPYYWALSFNIRHPQLRSAEIRRALSRAVNREEIVTRVFRGFGKVAVDPVWPLFWAYAQTPDRYEYDPASARRDLEHAGVVDGKSRRLTFRCLFYGEDPHVERMALMIQRQLADVGVQLDLQSAPLDELIGTIRRGDFDSFLVPTASGRALDWTYRFWHSPQPGAVPLQPTGYAGADAVLDELRHTFGDGEVRAGVMKLRRRFYEDPPAVFIAWQQATRAVSSRFDISDAEIEDAFANVWQWKPAERRE